MTTGHTGKVTGRLTADELERLHAACRKFAPLDQQLFPTFESILADREAALREETWDECCQAFAWAMKEEPNLAPVSWLSYVHEHNPYREGQP